VFPKNDRRKTCTSRQVQQRSPRPCQDTHSCRVKPGDVFLDAGCGDGYLSIAASRIVSSSGKVYAADIDEHSISSLKREIEEMGLGNIEAMVADVTKSIPLAEAG
jgi:tRNA A58 N-methylase Trm61